jgi:hypothetical protein
MTSPPPLGFHGLGQLYLTVYFVESYIFEGTNKIIPLFAKYDIRLFGGGSTGEVHKSLLNNCVLHENWRSDSHNLLGDK